MQSRPRFASMLAMAGVVTMTIGVTIAGPASAVVATEPTVAATSAEPLRVVATWTGPDGVAGTGSVSDERVVTVAEAAATGNKSLMAAAAAGTVKSQDWRQDYVDFVLPEPWEETHKGTYYYDGTSAWMTDTKRGVTGYHQCDLGYGIVIEIKPTACTQRAVGTSGIAGWDYFKTCVACISIVCTSHNMNVNLGKKGGISFYWEGKKDKY